VRIKKPPIWFRFRVTLRRASPVGEGEEETRGGGKNRAAL